MLCIEIIAYFTLTNRIEHDNRTMYTNHTWKKICILATGCRRLGIKKNGVKRQKRGKNVETEKNNAKVCFQILVALVFRILPGMTSIYIVICLTFFLFRSFNILSKKKQDPKYLLTIQSYQNYMVSQIHSYFSQK